MGCLCSYSGLIDVLICPDGFADAVSANDGDWRNGERARLQTLDKITARIATIDVPIGMTTQFGTLELYVHACKFPPAGSAARSRRFD